MKSLIIGATGFVGYYLIEELKNNGDDVVGTKLPFEQSEKNARFVDLDITDSQMVRTVIDKEKPDFIYHLAAQSSVALSWKKPQMTVQINVIGALNVMDAVRDLCPKTKILLIGSSEEYGAIDYSNPICEKENLNPQNVYAITKQTVEELGKLYAKAYGLWIMMTRSFNHIGARQSTQFVVADFCHQVAMIERGEQEPIILVGNLQAERDFTNVKDVVRAYSIIMSKGASNEVYNVGSGTSVEIQTILEQILSFSPKEIKVVKDEKKCRPIDVKSIICDNAKITSLGWKRYYSLEDTLKEVLTYFRNHK